MIQTIPTKSELKTLIDQLEAGLQDVLKSNPIDFVKANKLQNLIGNCIDLYNSDNLDYKNLAL